MQILAYAKYAELNWQISLIRTCPMWRLASAAFEPGV